MKNVGRNLSALEISGHLKKISPGPNGSEVGRQITLNSLARHPTSEPFGPGEIFFEWLQIARAGTFYPKFFKNHRDGQPRKFSLALAVHSFKGHNPWSH